MSFAKSISGHVFITYDNHVKNETSYSIFGVCVCVCVNNTEHITTQ